jgi:hypothetical protein
MRINEAVRKTVMFVGVKDDQGKFAPYGSAFIAQWEQDGINLSYLITARHVIEDMKRTGLQFAGRINHKDGLVITGDLQDDVWQYHPTIPNCDLAVASFIGSYEAFDIKSVNLNSGCITPQ